MKGPPNATSMHFRLRLNGTLSDVYQNVAYNLLPAIMDRSVSQRNCSIIFPSVPAQGDASEISTSKHQDGPFKIDGRDIPLI